MPFLNWLISFIFKLSFFKSIDEKLNDVNRNSLEGDSDDIERLEKEDKIENS